MNDKKQCRSGALSRNAGAAGKSNGGETRGADRVGPEFTPGAGKTRGAEASAAGAPSKRMTPSDESQRIKAASFLESNFLVEAGAGTGKTALLMERLRHIICRTDVSMEQVVAITFTEKAAWELKSRFREELERWGSEATGPEKERIDNALREIDRTAISTIHSFCLGLLMERPVEAGVDPGFRVADEVEREILFEAAWEQWLGEKMVPGNLKLKSAFLLGATLENAGSLAKALLKVRDVLAWIPKPVQVPDAGSLVRKILAEAASIRDLMRAGLRNPDDSIASEIDLIERTLESAGCPDGRDEVLVAAARLVSLRLRKKAGALNNWRSKETCRQAREILSGLRDELEEFRKAFLHNTAVGIVEELRDFVEVYNRVKQERGVLDFDDLLITARNLLRDSEEARSYFKRKYKFILIDEFQDTDPLQAEVAFFLAEEVGGHCGNWDEVQLENGKLFLVGDPKQSIYRFRRADIEVYERSKRCLRRQGHVVNICVNFRSTRGVIDPVNLAFEGLMSRPEGGDYQPDYVPLEAYRPGEAPGLVAIRPGRRLPKDLPVSEKRALEASAIAWLIKDAVEGARWSVFDKATASARGVRYADIALLFWATTGLDIYEEALRAWEIPYRVAGGKAFYSRGEIQALVSVLTAVEHPHDGVAVVGALRSPFFGLSDDEIFLHWVSRKSLNYEETTAGGEVGRAFAALGELRRLRNSGPLAVFMERLFEVTGALPAFYMRPQGEQRVANLLKTCAMAARLEEAGPVTFKRFVRWTAEQGERGVEEGESPVCEAGDDFASVLTIHKAKGLEFPVVILPALWSRGVLGAEQVVADRGAAGLEINLSRSSGIATVGYQGMWSREKDILEAERIRLLYVAMTRAREKLVLPCLFNLYRSSGDPKTGPGPSHVFHLRELMDAALHGGAPWAEVIEVPGSGLEARREKALRVGGGEAGGATDYGKVSRSWRSSLEGCIRRVARAAPLAHPTALVPELGHPALHDAPPVGDSSAMGEEEAAGKPRLVDAAAGDVGRRIGKLVHRLLELLDADELDDLEALARSYAADLGLGRGAVESAVRMVRGFYGSPFAKRVLAARTVHREMPFCVRLRDLAERPDHTPHAEDIVVEGTTDLLMEEQDGWRVVDFKTDKIDQADVAERAAHYRLQGACYALCLSAVIGEPVKEVIFYFLHPRVLHVCEADEAFVQDARVALAEKRASARRGSHPS